MLNNRKVIYAMSMNCRPDTLDIKDNIFKFDSQIGSTSYQYKERPSPDHTIKKKIITVHFGKHYL